MVARLPPVNTLVLATRNAHKVEEIRAVLGIGVRCLSLADLPPAPEVVEDAQTFVGNALKKARAVAAWLRAGAWADSLDGAIFVMADDSGLEVDALGGAPGVRSARYASEAGAGGNVPDALNNAKLLAALISVAAPARTARFRCAIALVALSDPRKSPRNVEKYQAAGDRGSFGEQTFEGTCEGLIALAPSGSSGFGYDPLFIPTGFTESFAQLGEEAKNRISHRGRALELVKESLEPLRAMEG